MPHMPKTYLRDKAPEQMQSAAEKYEEKYGIRFSHLTFFTQELLSEYHADTGNSGSSNSGIEIVSRFDGSILTDMRTLTEIANNPSIQENDRTNYYDALIAIYGKFCHHPGTNPQDSNTLYIGIEREGRILAESMDWLPDEHSIPPHAKRIPYESGLVVGCSLPSVKRAYTNCVIVDGAIASGATIISIVEKLPESIDSFQVFSIHATYEGLNALVRYCEYAGFTMQITVGHATKGMNSHFYAVDSSDSQRLVVGDLGDMICSVQDN